MSQRSGQPGINAQEIGNFKIKINDCNSENMCGDFFKILDERIGTQKKIIEDLKRQINQIRYNFFDTIDKNNNFIELSNIIIEYSKKLKQMVCFQCLVQPKVAFFYKQNTLIKILQVKYNGI